MSIYDRAKITIGIKGAGEMATGVACHLFQSGFTRIVMVEIARPLAVRRTVAFCEAVYDGRAEVEGIVAVRAETIEELAGIWERCQIPVLIDPKWHSFKQMDIQVLVDAILAKRNLGTSLQDAPLVIGLGPGFIAKKDVHRVIETMRGEGLGRVIDCGSALANTGVPAPLNGYCRERVLRAPTTGVFYSDRGITDLVFAGDLIGKVSGFPVIAQINGMLRGLIRPGSYVSKGLKIGDIDPRAKGRSCYEVSDKARTIGCGVLEAILDRTIFH